MNVLKKEKDELLGLFPPREQYDSKIIMVSFELARVHSRQQDYRNAYRVMEKLARVYNHNPWVLSRMGRLCLETGRKP